MNFYFQKSFIKEVKKLLKKNQYKDCEDAIINDIFIIKSEDIFAKCSASRLNTSETNPIAKLRIGSNRGKSSSYRVYLMALKVEDKMFFAYIHPKTGPIGKESLTKKEKIKIIKSLLIDIEKENFDEVYLKSSGKNKICYKDTEFIKMQPFLVSFSS